MTAGSTYCSISGPIWANVNDVAQEHPDPVRELPSLAARWEADVDVEWKERTRSIGP